MKIKIINESKSDYDLFNNKVNKKKYKKSLPYTFNPDAGNVEQSIEMFNDASFSSGEGMAENLQEAFGLKAVDLNSILDKCEKLASGLPQDEFAKETRKNYITKVYYTYARELKPISHLGEDGKKYVYSDDSKNEYKLETKYILSALNGSLASWYANEVKVNENAPSTWRKAVIDLIDEEFKSKYDEYDWRRD